MSTPLKEIVDQVNQARDARQMRVDDISVEILTRVLGVLAWATEKAFHDPCKCLGCEATWRVIRDLVREG
jgi:hypothetical protein